MSVDSRAFSEPSDSIDRREAHLRVARDFRAFCALRLLGPKDAQEIVQRLNANPQGEVAEIWAHLLKGLGTARIIMGKDEDADDHTMREYLEEGALPPGFARLVDLVLGSESAIQAWDGPPELTSARRFDLSNTVVTHRLSESQPTFAKGASRDEIWAKVWKRPAEISKQVWICSPYLFGVRPIRGSSRLEHVVWLLDHLDRAMPLGVDTKVHLLAAEGDYDIADVGKYVGRSAFCERRPGALNIHVARWRPSETGNGEDMYYGPHDRHIRFSCSAAFDLPSDFDRLQRKKIIEDQGFKCHYIGPGPSLGILESVEHGVMKHARSFSFGLGGLVELC